MTHPRKYCGLRDNGFSLLETLVALFIFSVLGVMGVQVLSVFADGQRSLAEGDKTVAELQMSGSMIRQDLNAAIMRPVRLIEGGSTPVYFSSGLQLGGFGEKELPVLKFTRGGHPAHAMNTELPSVQAIEYWFEDDTLLRKTRVRPDANGATPTRDQVLMTNLTDLTLRFRVAGNWVDEVDLQLGVRQTLPELVEITAQIKGKGSISRRFTVGARS